MEQISALVKREADTLQKTYPERTGLILKVQLAGVLIEKALRLLATKWVLRNCTTGKFVLIKGRPALQINGDITIGDQVRIWSTVNRTRLSVGHGARIEVGANTRLNGPTISAQTEVIIGKNCRIAPHVIVMDGDFHDVNDRTSDGKSARIVIGDGAWLATRSMVLKGVTVGEGAIVAAGTVVTKDVPPYTVVAGVPAKVIKHLRTTRTEAA